jgi:hypothetical protein
MAKQLIKAPLSIDSIEFPMLTDFKYGQFAKALVPISVTEFPI